MASGFLLDTNIVSELVRDPQGTVAARIQTVGERTVATSIIVAAELRYGIEKSGSTALRERVDLVLSALEVLPFEPPTDRIYGVLRADLTRRGMPIGPNDMLIAAHALARIAHRFTAADADLPGNPALRSDRVLDVLSSTPVRPICRAPCLSRYLHALASRIGERCGLAEKRTLVTANPGEFERVAGLAVENWLEP